MVMGCGAESRGNGFKETDAVTGVNLGLIEFVLAGRNAIAILKRCCPPLQLRLYEQANHRCNEQYYR